MRYTVFLLVLVGFAGLVMLAACDHGNDTPRTRAMETRNAPAEAETVVLTDFELEHGIGPITERVNLGPIDEALSLRGEDAYQMKCESCHRMEQRFVGPPMGDILERRSPEFVMNMMLNPAEMLQRHPVAQELLAEYMTPMPFQNVDQDEARAIVEYLRTVNN